MVDKLYPLVRPDSSSARLVELKVLDSFLKMLDTAMWWDGLYRGLLAGALTVAILWLISLTLASAKNK